VESIRAIDHSDFEGADIVFDLSRTVPDRYVASADFIFDGSVMDNVFSPSEAIQNVAKILRTGGRYFGINQCSTLSYAYVTFNPCWFFDFFVANGFDDVKVYVYDYFDFKEDANWLDSQIYYLDPALHDRNVTGYKGSPGLIGLLVIAEKGENSTWDRRTSQGVYRLENEWEVFNENLAKIQRSPRPVINLRRRHDFAESRSHGFRYLGNLDFLGLNTPEFELGEPGVFCDIDLSGTFAGYNWGHVETDGTGKFWRWIATDECGSHVTAKLLPGHDYSIRAVIHTADSHETLASLVVEVNGRTPQDAHCDWEEECPIYSGRIAASLASAAPDGKIHIVFRMAAGGGDASDRRLALSRLSLHPLAER
jgi:hypothetical protein